MGAKPKNVLVFADTDKGGAIHIANIKGGVGKSTVATNLASTLCRRGPTLLIDIDVQGSATHALGLEPFNTGLCSWELFKRRYANEEKNKIENDNFFSKLKKWIKLVESYIFPNFVGRGDVTALTVKVRPSLDLIPAGSDLFKPASNIRISNFIHNLNICKNHYKYIIIDTPSVWNRLTRSLFVNCDLNLIPVTLNALSTKSLRHYLLNVKKLTHRNPHVRMRIVKNEVFGRENSKIKGKTRTMYENRRFLENLCEQVAIRNNDGVSLLPQSLMFELEIPESATVRDAQDEGKSVQELQQYSKVTKAFEQLATAVQYVLNSIKDEKSHAPLFNFGFADFIKLSGHFAATALFLLVLTHSNPVVHSIAPRPIAPEQLIQDEEQIFQHEFERNQSIHRISKHAISRLRAVVPSYKQVDQYAREVVQIYNRTRLPDEPKLNVLKIIPIGTKLTFYPPSKIANPQEKFMVPVYRFFMDFVDDPLAYITGDWCERGSGGGQPHYGIDVAAAYGADIITPISGTVVLKSSKSGGRMLGVVKDKEIIFFAHMKRRIYKNGAYVKKGTVIGTIGMTGRTSGPHAHIGYGIKFSGRGGVVFGNVRYRLTDPKLFFYRQHFVSNMDE